MTTLTYQSVVDVPAREKPMQSGAATADRTSTGSSVGQEFVTGESVVKESMQARLKTAATL